MTKVVVIVWMMVVVERTAWVHSLSAVNYSFELDWDLDWNFSFLLPKKKLHHHHHHHHHQYCSFPNWFPDWW